MENLSPEQIQYIRSKGFMMKKCSSVKNRLSYLALGGKLEEVGEMGIVYQPFGSFVCYGTMYIHGEKPMTSIDELVNLIETTVTNPVAVQSEFLRAVQFESVKKAMESPIKINVNHGSWREVAEALMEKYS